MKIHHEGITIILVSFLLLAALAVLVLWLLNRGLVAWLIVSVFAVLFGLIVSFFRVPSHSFQQSDKLVYAPADGKIVVVEEVTETEYLKGRCRQVSIFMSPLNVHVNYYPVNGEVIYTRYHKGKYLVAWHPKSSEKNERSTVALRTPCGRELIVRQIAGAVARRIVTYSTIGEKISQGGELGFIKFGSRVDVFLPLDAKILVKPGQVSRGMQTIIAELP